MEQNLGNKLVKGTLWVVAARLGLRGISVISTIVLAWLLTPADFGIVAMASIVTTLMTAFTEIGMNQVIIYYKNVGKDFYDTAWTIQMIRGLILGLLMILLSNVLASFFREQLLVPVFRVLSIVFVLNGMVSTNLVVFQKEMHFDKEFYYKIFTQIICLIGTLSLAIWLRNYWAMVLGNIIFSLSCVVLSFWYVPGLPKLTLLHWRKIFAFSQWVFLREASGNISQKLDQILIGRWFDKTSIGQYDMATQIATLPATEIAMPLSRTLFPALAKLQDQPEQFRYMLSISLASVLLITLPASCGLMMVANPLVSFLLPTSWEQTGWMIQILTLYGLVRVTYSPCTSALTAQGKVNEVFYISFSSLILKCGILYLGYIYNGLVGIAWGTVISGLIITILYLWSVCRHNYLNITVLLKQICRPVIASFTMIGSVYAIQQAVVSMKYCAQVEVIAMVMTGVVAYTFVLLGSWWIIGKPEGIETRLLTMLSEAIKKLKAKTK